MSRLAWFKFYGRDWRDSTRDLELEERGAYLDLLTLMYERGGQIEDNPRTLARFLGIHTNKWVVLRQRLLDKSKLSIPAPGFLSNGRCIAELMTQRARAEDATEARSRAGKASAAMRAKRGTNTRTQGSNPPSTPPPNPPPVASDNALKNNAPRQQSPESRVQKDTLLRSGAADEPPAEISAETRALFEFDEQPPPRPTPPPVDPPAAARGGELIPAKTVVRAIHPLRNEVFTTGRAIVKALTAMPDGKIGGVLAMLVKEARGDYGLVLGVLNDAKADPPAGLVAWARKAVQYRSAMTDDVRRPAEGTMAALGLKLERERREALERHRAETAAESARIEGRAAL